MTTEEYTQLVMPGACTYFTTKIWRKRSGDNVKESADSPDQSLQNEVSVSVNNNDILLTVLPIIEKWVSQHGPTLCSRVTVWASRILAAHLNLPVRCSPPAGLLLQALILGQDLPPVLLTVYDETNFEDNENGKKRVHDYAIQMVQKQSRLLMNFCSCEFVVVPCTIEKRILTPEILENEVGEQKQKTRSYYRGPHSLSEKTYTKLKEAMTVLSAGSYVPCFLDESKKEWILQLDKKERRIVHQLLEELTGSGKVDRPLTHETLVTILEAVSRLALWKKVSIVTDDPRVKECVRKLKAQSVRQHGIDPCLSSSATAGPADVIITLSYFSPTPEQRTPEQCQDKSDDKTMWLRAHIETTDLAVQKQPSTLYPKVKVDFNEGFQNPRKRKRHDDQLDEEEHPEQTAARTRANIKPLRRTNEKVQAILNEFRLSEFTEKLKLSDTSTGPLKRETGRCGTGFASRSAQHQLTANSRLESLRSHSSQGSKRLTNSRNATEAKKPRVQLLMGRKKLSCTS